MYRGGECRGKGGTEGEAEKREWEIMKKKNNKIKIFEKWRVWALFPLKEGQGRGGGGKDCYGWSDGRVYGGAHCLLQALRRGN